MDKPADLPDAARDLPTAGRGPLLYPQLFPRAVELSGADLLDVDAGALAALAVRRIAAGAEMPVEPLYLRRPDTAAPAAPKPATPPQQQRRRGGRQQAQAQQ